MVSSFHGRKSFADRCSRLLAEETEGSGIRSLSNYLRKYFPKRYEAESIPKLEKLAFRGGSQDAVYAFGMLTYNCTAERREQLIEEARRLIGTDRDPSRKEDYVRSLVRLLKQRSPGEKTPLALLQELLKVAPAAQDRESAGAVISAAGDALGGLRSLSPEEKKLEQVTSTLEKLLGLYLNHEDKIVAFSAKSLAAGFKRNVLKQK